MFSAEIFIPSLEVILTPSFAIIVFVEFKNSIDLLSKIKSSDALIKFKYKLKKKKVKKIFLYYFSFILTKPINEIMNKINIGVHTDIIKGNFSFIPMVPKKKLI